jgi:hypothetical protein
MASEIEKRRRLKVSAHKNIYQGLLKENPTFRLFLELPYPGVQPPQRMRGMGWLQLPCLDGFYVL